MPYSHLTIHLSPRTPRGGLDLHRDARAAAVPLELQSPTGRFGGARKITHSPPGPPPSSPCPQPVPLLPSRLRSAPLPAAHLPPGSPRPARTCRRAACAAFSEAGRWLRPSLQGAAPAPRSPLPAPALAAVPVVARGAPVSRTGVPLRPLPASAGRVSARAAARCPCPIRWQRQCQRCPSPLYSTIGPMLRREKSFFIIIFF